MPQEGHTNLLSQRFAQPPKLAVIPDCLTAERNHLSHRKLILQVTSELHHVISLLLGCLQKKWTDKKKKVIRVFLSAHFPTVCFCMYPACLFSLPAIRELQSAARLISHITLTSRLNRNPHNQVSCPFNHFKEISRQSESPCTHGLPTQLSPALCTSEPS